MVSAIADTTSQEIPKAIAFQRSNRGEYHHDVIKIGVRDEEVIALQTATGQMPATGCREGRGDSDSGLC